MMFDPGTFRFPPARFRLKPFWFWNLPPAELTTERLERAIEDMAAHGLGGFVIFNKKDWGFNRDNFLNAEWMEKVRVAATKGARLGMEVWINDGLDFPPCDIAGRWRELCPQARPIQMQCHAQQVTGPTVLEKSLPACLFAVAVLWPAGKWEQRQVLPVRFAGGTASVRHEIGPGQFEFRFITTVEVGSNFPTLRHLAASEAFIRYGYEPYAAALGPLLGREITGFFSDADGMEQYDFPAFEGFFALFQCRRGIDLMPLLPALFEELPGGGEVRRLYWDFISDCYAGWFEANHRWCAAHGLLYTYHTSNTGPLGKDPIRRPFCKRSSYFLEGRYSAVNQHADFIGTDHELESLAGHSHINLAFGPDFEPWPSREAVVGEGLLCAGPEVAWPNKTWGNLQAKECSSLAHTLGRRGAMCEQFAASNWGLAPRRMRLLGGWQLSQGINFFVPHAHFESLGGDRRAFAPPSHGPGTQLWRHYRGIADWFARASFLGACGRHVADVALLEPAHSLWAGHVTASAAFFLAFDWLNHSPYDYDIVDEQTLLTATIRDGALHIQSESYRCLVLPGIIVMEPPVVDMLKRFQQQGGLVIAIGESVCPAGATLPESEIARGIEQRRQISNGNPLASLLVRHIAPDAVVQRVDVAGQVPAAGVHFLHRQFDQQESYLFFNLEDAAGEFEIDVRSRGSLQRLDLEDGNIVPHPAVATPHGLRFRVCLEHGECQAFLVEKGGAGSTVIVSTEPTAKCVLEIQGAESAQPLDPNWVPLHLWREDGQWKRLPDARRHAEGVCLVEAALNDVELWLPEALVANLSELRIGGQPIDLKSVSATVFLDAPHRTVIIPALPAGELRIHLGIKGALPDLTYQPVFLRGDFSVKVLPDSPRDFSSRGPSAAREELWQHHFEYLNTTYLRPGQIFALGKAPSNLRFEAWEQQGYPFYSGMMEYRFELTVPREIDGRPARLEFTDVREVLELEINGAAIGTRLWPRYRFNLSCGLTENRHRMVARVTNTSANRFEEAPQKSGLLGPLRVFVD